AVAALLRFDKLANQSRDDVGVLQVEVVMRPVEVDHEQVDAVEAVLLPICLELHQEELLGEPIRCVGLLRVAVPKVALPEGDRCEFWVAADGADLYELLETELAAQLDELSTHDKVVVEKSARVTAVGADAADLGREVENHRRSLLSEEPADIPLLGQVE